MSTRVEVGSSAGSGICAVWYVSRPGQLKSTLYVVIAERPTTQTWRRSEMDGVPIPAQPLTVRNVGRTCLRYYFSCGAQHFVSCQQIAKADYTRSDDATNASNSHVIMAEFAEANLG